MKASDLANVLAHIPGETEVADITIETGGVVITASKLLDVLKGVAPTDETPKAV